MTATLDDARLILEAGSTLLADACKVVKQFMARDPGELRFTIVALAEAGGGDA